MKTLFAVCMALLCMLYIQRAPATLPSSCGAAPYPVEIQQQDGSKLTVVATGNAIIHHTETTDGYTIIKNHSDIYEYALPGPNGELLPSGIKAKDADRRNFLNRRRVSDFPKHLRMGASREAELINSFRSRNRDPFYSRRQEEMRFPPNGTRKALVLLIQYPDLPNEYSQEDFESLMNEEDFDGTGSFRDYFLKNSYGQLDIEADVFGWYTAEHNFEHYGYLNGFQRTRLLMAEAIDAAEAAGVDFSQYDNDGDGKVDAVIGVHAGPGAEMGAQLQYIWSHRWTLGTYERTYDGVEITDYIINPETRPWGMVGVGVICHEFGHVLGLPDLYDSDNSSRGIGNWGIMGNGAWLNQEHVPSNMNAWCREELEWLTPEVITEGSFALNAVDAHSESYRINTPDPNEYFLLENRQQVGNDAYLPGSGLAIWHIDKNKTALYPNSNSVNADETNKGVDLEEADGLDQLDNGLTQGDDGDLFPGSAEKTTFTSETGPSSDLYDGSQSGISVTNIYEEDGVVYFRLNDPAVCGITNAVAGAHSGCGNGTYDQEIIVHYEYPPAEGQLVVNGHSFNISGSPQSVLLTNLPSDGQVYGINAFFSEHTDCAIVIEEAFVAPVSYDLTIETTTCDPQEAGQFLFNGETVDGCDSTVLLITTLLESFHTELHSYTCVAEEAGTTSTHYSAVNGCDSLVTRIVEYRPEEEVVIEATTCEPSEAGVVSHTYESEEGCDSVVTIVTTLLESPLHYISYVTCDASAAGTEEFHYSAANGCDSTVVITTIYAPSYEIYLDETTCDPNEAGIVTHLLTSDSGCDSMVTINTVYEGMVVSFQYESEEQFVSLTNTSINTDHNLWLFGDGSFYIGDDPVHEYESPGLYFVLLTSINNNCGNFDAYGEWILVEESSATVQEEGTEDLLFDDSRSSSMDIYPNPTFGPVHIETKGLSGSSARMSLYDINGKLVMMNDLPDINSTASFDLSSIGPGIYTMQVTDSEQILNKRIFLTN